MTDAHAAVAVFVKTPGCSPVKTRLAATIGQQAAEMFHRLSAMAVGSIVAEASSGLDMQPYWAVAEAEAIEDSLWRDFPAVAQGEGDLGRRLDRVYRLLRQRHRAVVFLGADSPQIAVDHIRQAFTVLVEDRPATVLGPCTDGGFYLCGGNLPLESIVWTDVAYGTDQAARHWCGNVTPAAPAVRLEILFDVDRFEDFMRLKAALSDGTRYLSRAQKKLLGWLAEITDGPTVL